MLLYPIVPETRLYAFLAVVAQQRVYVPQYYIDNFKELFFEISFVKKGLLFRPHTCVCGSFELIVEYDYFT
jgi:hypothetical protein